MKYALRLWFLLVGAGLLLSCAGEKVSRARPELRASRVDKRYPGIFVAPPRGMLAIGSSPLGAFSSDSSHARSARCALMQLGWMQHVRVRGERLAGGGMVSGQTIDLLETSAPAPADCSLDTLELDGVSWVVAGLQGSVTFGRESRFSEQTPGWVRTTPQASGVFYGRGMCEASYMDEQGSWELATYRALLDLAFSFSRFGTTGANGAGVTTSTYLTQTDVSLTGLRVQSRWRDSRNVHVLVSIPITGVVFHLSD